MFIPIVELGATVAYPRRRFSAMLTVRAMAKAMLAESERKPA